MRECLTPPGRGRRSSALRCLIAAVCGLWLARAAPAQAELADAEQAEELYRLSGMERLFDGLEDQITGQLAEGPGEAAPDPIESRLVAAARASFDTASIRAGVVASLAQNMEPEAAEKARSWLSSDTGRRITGLEEAAALPEARDEIEAYTRSVAGDPPAERLALLTRLEAATGTLDLALAVVRTMGLATAQAIPQMPGAGLPQGAPDPGQEFISRFESMLPSLRNMLGQQLLVMHLYTYRDLSDAELVSYIEHLESGEGQDYYAAFNQAILDSLDSATSRFRKAVAESGESDAEPVRVGSPAEN